MNEAQFRKRVVSCINKGGGHASSVESHATSPGIPDVDFCIEGVEGHVELKVITSSGLRPTQALWFRRRVKAGGSPWIMVYSPLKIYLISGKHHNSVITMNKEEILKWEHIATKIWTGMPSPQELAIGLKTNQH